MRYTNRLLLLSYLLTYSKSEDLSKMRHVTYFCSKQAVSQCIEDPVLSETPKISGRYFKTDKNSVTPLLSQYCTQYLFQFC